MADTRRTLAEILVLLADNTAGLISPQDIRDAVKSLAPTHGGFYISSAVETVIAGVDTWTKLLGTTTVAASIGDGFSMSTNNRLLYSGTPDVHIHITATLSMISASANQVLGFRVAKNGDATGADSVASEVSHKIATGADVVGVPVIFDGVISTGDYLELFIENTTSAGNVTANNGYLFAVGILGN
jgi:hypothetical protein